MAVEPQTDNNNGRLGYATYVGRKLAESAGSFLLNPNQQDLFALYLTMAKFTQVAGQKTPSALVEKIETAEAAIKIQEADLKSAHHAIVALRVSAYGLFDLYKRKNGCIEKDEINQFREGAQALFRKLTSTGRSDPQSHDGSLPHLHTQALRPSGSPGQF